MDVIENTAITGIRKVPGHIIPQDVAAAFDAGFLDEGLCRGWILGTMYADVKISCPQCRAPLTEKGLRRFWMAERLRCQACGKFFTSLTDTFLNGCHLSFREIMLLAVFLHYHINHREIARILKISIETVRLWEIKFSALQRIKGMRITEGRGVSHGII